LAKVYFSRLRFTGHVIAFNFGRLGFICGLLCLSQSHAAQPVADMHLHYKWSQQELTSPAEAVALLDGQDIVMGVVIGTPAELALELHALAPDRIVPIFSPYREGGDWHRWARDETTLSRARAALASGQYRGIGELHVIGGFAPPLEKAVVLKQLLELAAEFDVPVMIHTEFSQPDFMFSLCRQFPDTRILWAHSGAVLAPAAVDGVLARCGNVWGGLGARDPWRFVNNPITDANGTLLPGWRALLLKYPDRFMVGSDPVWPVEQLDSWDEGDSGWQELGRFWGFHRSWLGQLPPDVARRIGCLNAVRLFGYAQHVECEKTGIAKTD
jgi:predicted TIM-barrel fold metal-dependent hydrolase